jgi:hypothetical protein
MSTLPTAEQIQWAYQACASPDFASFTVDEKTAVMNMFLNVLQVLHVRFTNDAATTSAEASIRREHILAKIEEAKLEYATLKTMLAKGFKEGCPQNKNKGAFLSSDSHKEASQHRHSGSCPPVSHHQEKQLFQEETGMVFMVPFLPVRC